MKTKNNAQPNKTFSERAISKGPYYCNCFEYVSDYSKENNLTIQYVDVDSDKVPEPIYKSPEPEWRVWEKDYGMVVKLYSLENKNPKKFEINSSSLQEGKTRLYRAIHLAS